MSTKGYEKLTMTITDDQLSSWTSPAFNNEEERANTTKEAVKHAIDKHQGLKGLDIKVFPKGSYANNTNVRRDSDIDIAVEYKGMIQLEYADGLSFQDTGLSPYNGISKETFKYYLRQALESEFGSSVDSSGNKIFKLRGSDKILDADIIPCTSFQYYSRNGHIDGIELILNAPDGKRHFNFPDQHLTNGCAKNVTTSKRYKSIVRIIKNAKNYMVENLHIPDYHSFMIECSAYNVSNSVYLGNKSWREIVKDVCAEIWNYTKQDEATSGTVRWLEVNDIKYLFHTDQKWTREDAKNLSSYIFGLVNN